MVVSDEEEDEVDVPWNLCHDPPGDALERERHPRWWRWNSRRDFFDCGHGVESRGYGRERKRKTFARKFQLFGREQSVTTLSLLLSQIRAIFYMNTLRVRT